MSNITVQNEGVQAGETFGIAVKMPVKIPMTHIGVHGIDT